MAAKRSRSGAIKRPPRVRKIRLGTDFSGMDMPARALAGLGVPFINVFGSDSAAHCRRYLTAFSKPETLYEDVCTRTVSTMAKTDVYVWGAPCQPFSKHGKGAG